MKHFIGIINVFFIYIYIYISYSGRVDHAGAQAEALAHNGLGIGHVGVDDVRRVVVEDHQGLKIK